jgi:hypothetical protein
MNSNDTIAIAFTGPGGEEISRAEWQRRQQNMTTSRPLSQSPCSSQAEQQLAERLAAHMTRKVTGAALSPRLGAATLEVVPEAAEHLGDGDKMLARWMAKRMAKR